MHNDGRGGLYPLFVFTRHMGVTKEEIKNKILQVFNQLAKEDFFIVEIVVAGNENNPRITVLLDSDKGITIDECADISRVFNKELEVLSITHYTLEVSSPGLDYPLKLKRQYTKNVGRKLKIMTNDGDQITGILKQMNEESILIELPKEKKITKEMLEINLSNIKKANVLISF